MTDVSIRVGHVLIELAKMPAQSVHMVWTSVPYWGLRSYGTEPQVWGGDPACDHLWGDDIVDRRIAKRGTGGGTLEGGSQQVDAGRFEKRHAFCQRCGAWRGEHGLEPSFELWLAHEVAIFQEVRRVLRDDGTLWVNIGDAYASSSNGTPAGEVEDDDRTFRDKPFNTVGGVFKPKDRLMMPASLAIALRNDGWVLRDEIVWRKPNPMPSSVIDRTTPAHEMVYMFSKTNRPLFWFHNRRRIGTRTAPAPDYIWLDRARDNKERNTEPRQWRKATLADGKTKRWRRINLWQADDYFYDGFALMEPCSDDTHARIAQASIMDQTGGAKQKDHDADGAGLVGARGRSRSCNQILQGMAVTAGYADATKSGPNSRLRHDTNGTPNPRKGTAPNLPSHRGLHQHVGLHGNNQRASTAEVDRGLRESLRTAAPFALMRNKRSVWDIVLEPFGQAHFATAPTKLVEPCVRAGTSEKGVCPHCGAPWVRLIRKSGGTTGQAWHDHDGDDAAGNRTTNEQRRAQENGTYRVDHAGWSPTCECADNVPVPATVLDNFGGAATTGLVAARLGRRAVLIEIKPEYAGFGATRLRADLHSVSGVAQATSNDLPLFAPPTEAAD